MAAPTLSQDRIDEIEIQNNPPPDTGDTRKESVESTKQSQSSTEQSQSNSGQQQQQQQPPAVDAADKIDTLPSPSSSKQTPQPDPFTYSSALTSFTASCAKVGKQTGCKPRSVAALMLAFVFTVVTIVFNYELFEVMAVWWSFGMYAFLTWKFERGAFARRPPIPIEENKRNAYQDVPSLNEGDPMEPPCPRPQQPPPKELVYRADVHNPDQPTSPSSPSTSSAAKGVDPKGASGSQSSNPLSPDVVIASADVHATPLETEGRESES